MTMSLGPQFTQKKPRFGSHQKNLRPDTIQLQPFKSKITPKNFLKLPPTNFQNCHILTQKYASPPPQDPTVQIKVTVRRGGEVTFQRIIRFKNTRTVSKAFSKYQQGCAGPQERKKYNFSARQQLRHRSVPSHLLAPAALLHAFGIRLNENG